MFYKKFSFVFIAFTLIVLSFSEAYSLEPSTTISQNTLTELSNLTFNTSTRAVSIQLSSKNFTTEYNYVGNDRFVLDIGNCKNMLKTNSLECKDSNILRIRNSQFKTNPYVSRIVIDVKSKETYTLTAKDSKITITFGSAVKTNPSGNASNSTTNNSTSPPVVDYSSSNNTNTVLYEKSTYADLYIPNLKALNFNLTQKTLNFDLDLKYRLDKLAGISDEYVKEIQIISGYDKYTIVITLQKDFKVSAAPVDKGLKLIIQSNSNNNTNNSNRIILLDPGHGGKDRGNGHNGIIEKDLNLEISLKVRDALEKKGIKVYMTRATDTCVNKKATKPLEELLPRVQYAENVKADFFISIHTNSDNKSPTAANGIEVEYYPSDGEYKKTLQKGKLDSYHLSCILEDELIKTTNANRRRIVSRPGLAVLKYSKVVPALIEMGFSSNIEEAERLKTDEYKLKLVTGITNGILKAYENN